MTPIRSLGVRFEIDELLAQIHANPSVWNRHKTRLYGVHSDVSDIWVRYNAWENFKDQASFNQEHESVWYPVLAEIPAVKPLVLDVMRCVEGERLGGVLITKIPPGKEVKPHRDQGWHASYYEKFAVQLQSAHGQAFCFADGCLSAVPGELYTFDNSQTHWVINQSQEDRMTLICCIRRGA
jgi:hypothetical protein